MPCLKCNGPFKRGQKPWYGLHEECFCDWFALPVPIEFAHVALRSSPDQDSPVPGHLTSSFQGKFRKYSADLGGERYILKVEEADYPELPAVEYLSNRIARHLGLTVADFYLIDLHGLITFVAKNFIRPGKLTALHHLYHYLPPDDPFSVAGIFAVIERETGRPADARRFAELCLFDALIGNHDRHGRNLALIETARGKRLSPFYDNPSYIGIELEKLLGAQLNPTGKIATSATAEPTMSDYAAELIALGYRKTVLRFYDRIALEELTGMVEDSTLGDRRKKAFSRLMTARYGELHDAIQR